jgi:superfamily II DNA or RNA helicase
MFTTNTWSTSDARILSHRGYAIRKDQLTPVQTRQLRAALTMKPQVAEQFSAGIEPFPIYYESPSRWYVPRFWGIDNCGEADGDARQPGRPLRAELQFNKQLRPEQLPIVGAFKDGGYNGLICVPCGYGKTFMAIWLACQLRKRFLVVVHQEFLMEQWRKELEGSIPGIRIGKLQGPKAQLSEEYDCCICMLQTVASRDWPVDAFSGFGFTIFDECHHLGAEHFSKALMSIQTRNMLGLSATPGRLDGLDNVFLWYLGPVRYQIKVRDPDESVEVRVLKFTSADPEYANEPTDVRGEISRPRLCNQLAAYGLRTKAICDELTPCLTEGRKLLILSDRIAHLEVFKEEFVARGFTSVDFYIGGMKAAARDESATKQIILASFTMAAEGMNIPSLNTVALVTPKSRIEQAVGRIFRQKKEERTFHPVIFDIIDEPFDILMSQYKKREAFYKQCGYKIMTKRPGDAAYTEKKRSGKQHTKDADALPSGVPMFR